MVIELFLHKLNTILFTLRENTHNNMGLVPPYFFTKKRIIFIIYSSLFSYSKYFYPVLYLFT